MLVFVFLFGEVVIIGAVLMYVLVTILLTLNMLPVADISPSARKWFPIPCAFK